jgi:heme A synthase
MPHASFRRFAWFFLAYLIAVILFGAWVRITGSGNGCGSHWPMCNGEVIPQEAAAKTRIEYTHRLTSGMCGIFAIVLVAWARRVGPAVLRAAGATLFFVLVEALLGAVLVKKELVAGDASVARAIAVSLHLANTMLLTASAATTAWWAGGERRWAPAGSRFWLSAALVALLLTNMTGAVTALGDTLFPIQPALDGNLLTKVREDLSGGQHFLVRLRILHPIVAVLASGVVLAAFAGVARGDRRRGTLGRTLDVGQISIIVQLLLGGLNVVLAAPGWMQVVHLLAAQVVWVAAWLVAITAWPKTAQSPAGSPGAYSLAAGQ